MLTVIKTLNNNIILAVTDNGEELVAFGTGIGFKRKKGDLVDEKLATKIFQSDTKQQASHLLEGLTPEILGITEKIINLGEEKLKQNLNPSILFSLSDHLRFAVDRKSQEIEVDTPLQWEIPHLYFEEYQVGVESLNLIKQEFGVTLPKTEASFIALHLVNAQIENQTMGETIQATTVTKNIVKIIQSLFELTLDKTTINYSRFITHLRYFLVRQRSKEVSLVEMDVSLKEIIQERYMKSYACGLMIKDMLEREYGWRITEDELVYLVIHIERIVKENKIK